MAVFEHNNISYEVASLTGWQSHILNSLTWDVFKIISFAYGVKFDNLDALIKHAPNSILQSREPFTLFCLTTKASEGFFENYNLTKLRDVVEAYNFWLDLMSYPAFYELWSEAYLIENKEVTDNDVQKKE